MFSDSQNNTTHNPFQLNQTQNSTTQNKFCSMDSKQHNRFSNNFPKDASHNENLQPDEIKKLWSLIINSETVFKKGVRSFSFLQKYLYKSTQNSQDSKKTTNSHSTNPETIKNLINNEIKNSTIDQLN